MYFILFYRAEYEHPLVVGNVKMKANSLGCEMKTINDWQQFIEDKDVRGIMFSEDNQRKRKSGFFQNSEEFKNF